MVIRQTEKGIEINELRELSLAQTLDCGQCFRWKQQDDGSWQGIVRGKICKVQQTDTGILFADTTMEDFLDIWYGYFDLGRDYRALQASFSVDKMLREACAFAPGIRVLCQEPWEAFVTFIISQNNNITRIKGIVERLCRAFGEEISNGQYAFPSPERLASASEDDLRKLGCGYRAAYIRSAAEEVFREKLDFNELKAKSTQEAKKRLTEIYGIGLKVADCILLYGLGKTDCCPMDVWMKRVLDAFGGKLPDCTSEYAGIAQQYLFHYARNFPEKFVNDKK